MFNEYLASQAALVIIICNSYLDDECKMSEGEIKNMVYDLVDMIEE